MLKNKNRILIFAMVVLLVLSLIGSASWMIVKRLSDNATNGKPESNPYFTSSVVYQSGAYQFPTPVENNPYNFETNPGSYEFSTTYDDEGYFYIQAKFEEYTVEWLSGKDPDGNDIVAKDNIEAGALANAVGVHYFKITDNKTNQVISDSHAMYITIPLYIYGNVTPDRATATYYEGEVPTFTGTLRSTYDSSLSFNNVKLKATEPVKLTGTSATSTASITAAIDFESVSFNTSFYSVTEPTKTTTGTVHAVAYTANAAGAASGTYYGTIEKAIAAANSGTNKYVYVSESLTDYSAAVSGSSTATYLTNNLDSYKSLGALTIKNDTTINSGVTLVLACVENSGISTTITNDDKISGNTDYDYVKSLTTSASSASVYNSTKLVHNISVADGITLTNNGNIQVGGVIYGGASGKWLNSYTVSGHGQITLGRRSIVENTGMVECYGFIAEKDKDNESVFISAKGTLCVVFSVVEHYGGSAMFGLINPGEDPAKSAIFSAAWDSGTNGGAEKEYTPDNLQTTPFNRFYFETVTCKMKVQSQSTVNGFVDLYANSAHNCANISLIGRGNRNLIDLKLGSSYVNLKYDYTQKKHQLDVYGDMSLNPLGISLTVSKEADIPIVGIVAVNIKVTLSSKDVLFCISQHFDITLNPISPSSTANVDLTNQGIKLLPGSSLKIMPGVKVNAKTIAVYDADEDTLENLNFYNKTLYKPTANNPIEEYSTDPAVLEVGGTLIVENIGGVITPIGPSAILNISGANSVVSLEQTGHDPGQTADFTVTSMTYTGISYSEKESSTFVATGPMFSGSTVVDTTIPLNIYGATASNGKYCWEDISDTSYNITYEYVYGDGVDSAKVGIHSNTLTTFKYSTDPYTLINPTGYTSGDVTVLFVGWFTDAECSDGNQVTVFRGSDFAGSNVTLYGKWTAEKIYTINFNTGSSEITIAPIQRLESQLALFDPDTYNNGSIYDAITSKDNDITIRTYFDGWYLDSDCTEVYDATKLKAKANGTTITLYSKWSNKSTFTVTNNTSNVAYVIVGGNVDQEVKANETKDFYIKEDVLVTVKGSHTKSASFTTAKAEVTLSVSLQSEPLDYDSQETEASFLNWFPEATANVTGSCTVKAGTNAKFTIKGNS